MRILGGATNTRITQDACVTYRDTFVLTCVLNIYTNLFVYADMSNVKFCDKVWFLIQNSVENAYVWKTKTINASKFKCTVSSHGFLSGVAWVKVDI